MALRADDRLRAVELHRQRRTAARAGERASLQLARAAVLAQARQRQLGELQATADVPARRPAVDGRAVVDAGDLASRIAQLGDDIGALQRRHERQLALGGPQLRGGDAGDRPALAGEHLLGPDAQRLGRRQGLRWRRRLEAEDVAAVVLAEPAGAWCGVGRVGAVEQRMPFVPAAARVAHLQPADQRERRALPAPGGAELQRAVVVEQLGALADAPQRVALAQQRAAAVAADRQRRRGRAELDRRAAVGAGGAVGALGRGFGGQGSAVRVGAGLHLTPASSAARPFSPRTPRR